MTCDDVAKKFGLTEHCDSCHDDEQMGYEMCSVQVAGEWVDVCCRVMKALADKSYDIPNGGSNG